MSKNILSIDYGDKKVGLAIADTNIKIPVPETTIINDENLIKNILKIIKLKKIDLIVIGYPRNQSGEPTKQTKKVENFSEKLNSCFGHIIFQDESLTSVLAEERLQKIKKKYTKEDIDAQAAVIILEDYLRITCK